MEFLKKNPLSEEELSALYVDTMGGFFGEKFDRKLETEFFDGFAQLETAGDFLRMTMEQDIKRHFQAETPMAQFQAKGAYSRTLYFLKGIQAARGGGKPVESLVPEKKKMK